MTTTAETVECITEGTACRGRVVQLRVLGPCASLATLRWVAESPGGNDPVRFRDRCLKITGHEVAADLRHGRDRGEW